jgi:hypothetical protein
MKKVVMNDTTHKVFDFLIETAKEKSRVTYLEVNQYLGRKTGRGLKSSLDKIAEYCRENNLPNLATIVVAKGTQAPVKASHKEFERIYGDTDFEKWQNEVFNHDWDTSHSSTTVDSIHHEFNDQDFWLTSIWRFNPSKLGGLGFTQEGNLKRFVKATKSGAIVFIYGTKQKAEKDLRGKVVGALEVSHTQGHIKDFMPKQAWDETQNNSERKGKWEFALKVTRAWEIVKERRQNIEQVFPNTYSRKKAQHIGAAGTPINTNDIENIKFLPLKEVPVFGGTSTINPDITTMASILAPSKAGPIQKNGFWNEGTDGPRYLYILKLSGNASAFLGQEVSDDKFILKVGVSKDPNMRCNTIQRAYPDGQFRWIVWKPKEIAEIKPFADGSLAIIGEDAMKMELLTSGAKSLGHEFFLATQDQAEKAWYSGNQCERT